MSTSVGDGSVIHHKQVVSLFLSACPELAPAWEEECRTWDLDPADGMELKTPDTPYPGPYPQLYTGLSHIIWKYLLGNHEAGRTTYFPAIFDLVEKCIVEGDDFVSEWAVIGVLEDLQGAVLRKDLPDDTFFPWFGPQSKDFWRELHRSWGTGPFAADQSPKKQP